MQIVIDIPDKEYETLSKLSEKEKVNELSYYERVIANGTPLPKGHGDLIDREKLKSFKCAEHSSDKEDIDDYETEEERDLARDRKYFYRSGWNDAVEFIIEKAPAVIPADKEKE